MKTIGPVEVLGFAIVFGCMLHRGTSLLLAALFAMGFVALVNAVEGKS